MERVSQKVDEGEPGVLVSTVQSLVGHWKLKQHFFSEQDHLSEYDLRFRDAPIPCRASFSFTIFS
ncbi:uncharacterized protein P174DRAFT_509096 [Aspergillus novofumigatus IBT 16806]|uniref:Uncharacterized protein n=1 Tax=Aspergillus novofumigatus (strain IBT 16806) TaxID=1392255 RepID=A0A2I1CMY1_ASPN1|nr:uncharacterized protein P174DRAFT_509096 [Aspergillus novofumigatus IBT 16806]PKX98976.1 hypothetical protein P174DRAFT_509096 [Aspergillus novofumigatus IBT 16806]